MMNSSISLRQRGAVTLLTALILLICITLVTLLASKTVLVETQISADNYRMAQAVAAANAAMDFGVGYFDNGGFDQKINATGAAGNDGIVDTIPDQTYVSADGVQTTTASLTFNNAAGTRCVAAGATPNMKGGLITAIGRSGRSDDGLLAVRTISQCVGTIDIFGGNGPKQSLISRGGVGLTGNYQIINRYYNTTAWAGNAVNIGESASASTYLRPIGTSESDFTQAELEDTATNNDYTSQPISDRNKGNGVDTIANDPRLSSLTGDQFFNNFFYGDRVTIKGLAASLNQVYSAGNIGSAQNKSGVVWIDGNTSLNGGTYGTPTNPVVMIINGNLEVQGNPVVNGLLYVTGQLDAKGTVKVLGSVIVEGDAGMVPAGEDPVVGHGGVDLIYSPYTLDRATNPIIGTTTVISGSWRDW
jgi:Tfp pilus assembly protein PilX